MVSDDAVLGVAGAFALAGATGVARLWNQRKTRRASAAAALVKAAKEQAEVDAYIEDFLLGERHPDGTKTSGFIADWPSYRSQLEQMRGKPPTWPR